MRIHLVCGARPNFMKIAPLYHALKRESWADPVIVHSGQHYDSNMSDAFFEDLRLPKPDISLGVGSGTHAEQTGNVLIAYEKILLNQRPDLVVVVGDVNSTMAATLASSKLGIRVAHLEAGLRSFDRTMPEEINRIVTDSLADMLWTPSADADQNLLNEGVRKEKIHRVGNIMIDSLEMLREKIEKEASFRSFGLSSGAYGVVTMHRPSNVDNPDTLKELCTILKEISVTMPLIFPIHPRTRGNMAKMNLLAEFEGLERLLLPEPINYIRFMSIVFNCRFVITDSGGIQEETSYLGIPCFTLRENTERPVTVTHGTNQLCNLGQVTARVNDVLYGREQKGSSIDLWDGKTADRIIHVLKGRL
jgi:UDP-N-acetylglucosamine 2-epimerase (non-hydrolysing)